MAQVFRVERNKNFTVMSNHHFKNKDLSLKAKGLLSLMLSLPEDWNYNMQGLASLSRDGIDSVRSAIKELEHYGYYGIEFSKILLTTSFLFGMFYVLSNALQAMGAATAALIINMSRQGLIYIPAIFILQAVIGMEGLLWAQPVADILSVILVIVLYRITLKNKMRDL